MGNDILPGHQYSDGEFVSGPSLTDHVGEATIKPSFFSSKTAKDPAVLTDEFLIRDTVADSYRRVSLATLQGLMVGPGGVIQTSYGEYTANTNLMATIPVDDTIPQNTEGTEILAVAITPKFSSSRILARFQAQYSNTPAPSTALVALFRDANANALASQISTMGTASFQLNLALEYMDSPSTTSAITYRIRIGPGAGAIMRLNGNPGQRYMGGSSRATLTLQEIKS